MRIADWQEFGIKDSRVERPPQALHRLNPAREGLPFYMAQGGVEDVGGKHFTDADAALFEDQLELAGVRLQPAVAGIAYVSFNGIHTAD